MEDIPTSFLKSWEGTDMGQGCDGLGRLTRDQKDFGEEQSRNVDSDYSISETIAL